MTKKSVLAIGIDPAFADFTTLPGLTPELVRHHIEAQLDQVRAAGFDVESCLIDLGETAEAVVVAALKARPFDCVMIGAGLREPAPRLLLFEKIINLSAFARTGRPHLLQPESGRHARCRAALGLSRPQINRIPFRLAWPFLPTMMWSCTEMPSGLAMSMIALVIWMSAFDGVGSPEGWLCTRISAVADNSSARLITSRG